MSVIIETPEHIAAGLAALAAADPRLPAVISFAGEVPLRRRPPSFAALVQIIISQQVSVASANAIGARLAALVDPLEAHVLLSHTEEALGGAGLSRPKIRAVRALADAVSGGWIFRRLRAFRPMWPGRSYARSRASAVGRRISTFSSAPVIRTSFPAATLPCKMRCVMLSP